MSSAEALFRKVGSIRDYLPRDQDAKLAVLDDIRRMLDDHDLDVLGSAGGADARRCGLPPTCAR